MVRKIGKGFTLTLLVTVFITCFGSSMLIGYNLGVLNLPGDNIKKFLSEKILNKPVNDPSHNGQFVTPDFLYAQVSTVFVVAGAIGAFGCGIIAEKVGRRNGLLINHVFAIVGSVIAGPCVEAGAPALLYVGRAVQGINCGITIGIGSMYLMEVAPRDLRGAIGACVQLAVTLGILIAYILTIRQILNTEKLWPVAVGISAIPAVISLVVLPFCPESPRFLYMNKNDEIGARKAFARLNVSEDVEVFLGEMRDELEAARNQPKFKCSQLFTQKDLRMAVAIACVIQILQQLSGINAVISYSSIMLLSAGIREEDSQYIVIAIGAINVVMTIVSVPLLERAGRRTLLLWPTVVLAISLLILTITVNLAEKFSREGNSNASKALGIVSAVFIIIYIIGFALGLGPIPSMIVAEIFRQGPRAAAYALSQGLQWLSNLLVLCSFPSINAAIGGYSFLPFLVVVVVCWVFFFFFMPETRNRTFDEIATILAEGRVVVGKRARRMDQEFANPIDDEPMMMKQ